MGAMTIGQAEPRQHPLTVDDLARTPADGRRYELVNGRLDVSPAPVHLHTLIESRLTFHLTDLAPDEFTVLVGPGVNFNADRTHHRIPDLAVIHAEASEHPYLTRPPLLAVEVVSPDSVFRDHHVKAREYAEFGVPSYWIINPSTEKPGLLEMRLEDGVYRERAEVFGADVFTTDAPFPITLVPYWLVAGGSWKARISGG